MLRYDWHTLAEETETKFGGSFLYKFYHACALLSVRRQVVDRLIEYSIKMFGGTGSCRSGTESQVM
jgi:hypothetical protein